MPWTEVRSCCAVLCRIVVLHKTVSRCVCLRRLRVMKKVRKKESCRRGWRSAAMKLERSTAVAAGRQTGCRDQARLLRASGLQGFSARWSNQDSSWTLGGHQRVLFWSAIVRLPPKDRLQPRRRRIRAQSPWQPTTKHVTPCQEGSPLNTARCFM